MRQAARVLLVAPLLMLAPSFGRAQTAHVPADYPTIQGAIDAGNSLIYVAQGTYHEVLGVSADLQLLPELPPNDGSDAAERTIPFPSVDGLAIPGSDIPGSGAQPSVYVRGFHFTGPLIHQSGQEHWRVTFEACRFDSGFVAAPGEPIRSVVRLRGCLIFGGVDIYSYHAEVTACTVVGGGIRIRPEWPLVRDNLVLGPADIGISAPTSDGGYVAENIVRDVTDGIVGGSVVEGNHVENCIGTGITLDRGRAIGNEVVHAGLDGFSNSRNRTATPSFQNNRVRGVGRHGFNILNVGDDHSDQGGAYLNGNTVDSAVRSGIHAETNTFSATDSNLVVNSGDHGIWIEGNTVQQHTAQHLITRNVVIGSAANGIRTDGNADGNVVGRSGHAGIVAGSASHNTSYLNRGTGYELGDGYPGAIDHNIAYENSGYGLVWSGNPGQQLGCNDWFNNGAGQTSGIAPGPTDVALDPLFCDVANDSVTLRSDSPILDAPGCGLIGARGQGCIDGSTETLTPGGGAIPGTSQLQLALLPPSPSPAKGDALIAFTLPTAMAVRLTVLDVQGRVTTELARGVMEAGKHEVRWNASQMNGQGIYFVRMEAGNKRLTRRLPLLY